MFLYEKKIIYLTFFWDGIKKSSAGFVRISREREACILDIHIKRIAELPEKGAALILVLEDRQCLWGNVEVRAGEVNVKRSLPVRGDMLLAGEESFKESELCGILIPAGERKWIAGYWKEPNRSMEAETHPEEAEKAEEKQALHATDRNLPDKKEAGKEFINQNDIQDAIPEDCGLPPGAAFESKWEQLQSMYKRVHPFGDERVFLSIEPRDFVILRAPYQRLVNNSFLLHGFYNYRHLILGPDKEIGNGGEECFYLGVPGTYFEREKMVAVMFGFEGFESNGTVEIGTFGYYMRRVEL